MPEIQRTRRPRGRLVVCTAAVCVVVLLAASVVEAAHFCELFEGSATAQASALASPGTAPRICLICATAHQVSMGAAATSLSPTFVETASTPLVAVQPDSRLQAFTMDVRPPPQAV